MSELVDITGSRPSHRSRGDTGALARFVVVACVLLAAGLALVPFEPGERPGGATDPKSSAVNAGANQRDESVPSASEAFADRAPSNEQHAPTF